MNRSKIKYIVGYVVLYMTFLFLSCYTVSYADDLVFKAGIERYGSFMGWVNFFSHNWGGRVVPQGILVLLLQLPDIVFHFFDAFAWVLLLFYFRKIFDHEQIFSLRVVYSLVIILIFSLIPFSVLSGAVFWKCANVLYLWGSAAVLVAVYPVNVGIQGNTPKTYDYIFAVIAIIYASSFEQAGALMCGVFLLLIAYALYSRIRLKWQDFVLVLFAIAATFFFCLLPGNEVRSYAETLGQLPKYDMYSFTDKILWGLFYTISNVENDAMFVVLFLAGTVAYIMHKNRRRTDLLRLGAYVVLGYFVLCTLNHIGIACTGNTYFIAELFKLVPVDTVTFGVDVKLIIRSVIHFLAYVYLGSSILVIDPKKLEIIGFTFFFGSLATMCVMGFSPTIYASGARPRFLCYLFLIFVEIRIISSAASGCREYWNALKESLHKKCVEEIDIGIKINLKWVVGIVAGFVGVIAIITVVMHTPSLPVKWKDIAAENEEFTVPAMWIYRFGAEDQWNNKILASGIYSASTPTFGGTDPTPGVVKKVEYLEIPDQFWSKVCEENDQFALVTQTLIRYGSDEGYCYKILEAGDYTATNKLFGGAPANNSKKSVWISKIPEKYWKKIADENDKFFCDTGIYRYGADDTWNLVLLDAGQYTAGDGDAFGTDPLNGARKEVYKLNIKIDK